MSKLVIGFSKSKVSFPIIGTLISWFQKGRYSHTYLKIWNEYREKWVVIDATSHGVRVGTIDEFLRRNRPVKEYTFDLTNTLADQFLWWGLEESRKSYSMLEVIGNLFQLTFNLKKNPFGQGKEYLRCNELVALAIEEVLGVVIDEDLDNIDLIWLDQFLEDYAKGLPGVKWQK